MDKSSMNSDRSFKISGGADDMLDTASISSFPKRNRLSQLTTQQQRNVAHGSASNIPEVDQLISKVGSSNTADSTSQKCQTADSGRWVEHFQFLKYLFTVKKMHVILIKWRPLSSLQSWYNQ